MSEPKHSRSPNPHRDVPADVVRAIGAVSARRLTDMYDRETVMMLAAAIGFEREAEWLVDHRHLYFIALELSGAVEDGSAARTAAHVS
jgi:hypothetical protein